MNIFVALFQVMRAFIAWLVLMTVGRMAVDLSARGPAESAVESMDISDDEESEISSDEDTTQVLPPPPPPPESMGVGPGTSTVVAAAADSTRMTVRSCRQLDIEGRAAAASSSFQTTFASNREELDEDFMVGLEQFANQFAEPKRANRLAEPKKAAEKFVYPKKVEKFVEPKRAEVFAAPKGLGVGEESAYSDHEESAVPDEYRPKYLPTENFYRTIDVIYDGDESEVGNLFRSLADKKREREALRRRTATKTTTTTSSRNGGLVVKRTTTALSVGSDSRLPPTTTNTAAATAATTTTTTTVAAAATTATTPSSQPERRRSPRFMKQVNNNLFVYFM